MWLRWLGPGRIEGATGEDVEDAQGWRGGGLLTARWRGRTELGWTEGEEDGCGVGRDNGGVHRGCTGGLRVEEGVTHGIDDPGGDEFCCIPLIQPFL